ncbi:hypothetical protein EQH57_0858, partial [Dictyocoela roeselum]
MLESLEDQDIFRWKEEFEQTMMLAAWTETAAVGVIKASCANKYLSLIQDKSTLNDIWATLLKYKYPHSDHLKYLNKLWGMRQNSFLTIKEYRDKIVDLCTRLAVCLDWGTEIKEHRVVEAFYNGLSKRCQLEMSRLNVKTCQEMYSLINTTEETIIEQIKTVNFNSNKHGI